MRAALCLCLSLIALAAPAEPARCTLDTHTLDRGERRTFLLCGQPVSADSRLEGLDAAGIDVLYRQNLQHCYPGDRRPGLFLELHARADAGDAVIRVLDAATGDRQCEVALEVPERWLLPAAVLTAAGEPDTYYLRVDAHEAGAVELSGACAAGLHFPPGQGPDITMLADPAPRCTRHAITATVHIEPGRQRPAKILLTARDATGNALDAISYVDAPEPAFTDAMAESDAKFIDVNGVRTRYFDKGTGEALILVHGGQPSAADFNAWEWQQNFDGLAEHFRVLALDRIGQGYTDNPADIDDYGRYYPLVVEHLLGFIDALGLERVHLVGHSQGGWPVTRLALDHPERVASLVIVDSTLIAPSGNVAQAVRFYIYQQNELHPPGGETAQSIRRGLAFFSYTDNNITDQRVQRILALSRTDKYRAASDWFNAHRMNPAHPDFRRLKENIWADMLAGRLRVPTLIIWGREDPEGSFPAGVAMYEALKEAGSPVVFRPFDQSGHVPYMEYPEKFNRLVAEFCRGN